MARIIVSRDQHTSDTPLIANVASGVGHILCQAACPAGRKDNRYDICPHDYSSPSAEGNGAEPMLEAKVDTRSITPSPHTR